MVTASSRGETSEVARHIARVAARLFAEQGYDATPVRTIVEAAGVTKPTLYYHFGSKEGLAQALLTVPLERLARTLRGLLDDDDLDPVAMLEATFEAHFDFCREDPDRSRFVYSLLFGPLGTGLAGELERFRGSMGGLMEEAVGRLADAGIVARDRVVSCATACRGLIIVSTIGFIYKGAELGPGLAGCLVGDLLRGFGEPGALGRGSRS
jgi:AcrR family transcriptional regulator